MNRKSGDFKGIHNILYVCALTWIYYTTPRRWRYCVCSSVVDSNKRIHVSWIREMRCIIWGLVSPAWEQCLNSKHWNLLWLALGGDIYRMLPCIVMTADDNLVGIVQGFSTIFSEVDGSITLSLNSEHQGCHSCSISKPHGMIVFVIRGINM